MSNRLAKVLLHIGNVLLAFLAGLLALWGYMEAALPSPEAYPLVRLEDPPARVVLLGFGGLLAGLVASLVERQLTLRVGALQDLERYVVSKIGRFNLLTLLPWIGFVGPLGEELVFRGLLLPSVGLVASTLIFGVVHFHFNRVTAPWLVLATLHGALLGLLTIGTGALLPAILYHAAVNCVSLRAIYRLRTA